MALKVNIENIVLPKYVIDLLELGNCTELYLKIDQQSGNSELTSIMVSVKAITGRNLNEYYTRNIPMPTRLYSFVPDLQGANFIEQGYEYLKTLPEFEGCEDC